MNTTTIKLIVALALCAGLFYSGMRVERAFTAERDLAIKEASAALIKTYQAAEAGTAKVLEDKLATLKANERLVIRETQKIVDRPVYRNECLDADGLHAIERARTGQTSASEPADEMPATD
jgi:hypothetical protein